MQYLQAVTPTPKIAISAFNELLYHGNRAAIVCVIVSLLQTIPAVASALDTVFEGSGIGKPLYDLITSHVNEYLNTIDFNTLLAI